MAPQVHQAPLLIANAEVVNEQGNLEEIISELKEAGDVSRSITALEAANEKIKGDLFAPTAAGHAADATAELVDAIVESDSDEAIEAVAQGFTAALGAIQKESKTEAFAKELLLANRLMSAIRFWLPQNVLSMIRRRCARDLIKTPRRRLREKISTVFSMTSLTVQRNCAKLAQSR